MRCPCTSHAASRSPSHLDPNRQLRLLGRRADQPVEIAPQARAVGGAGQRDLPRRRQQRAGPVAAAAALRGAGLALGARGRGAVAAMADGARRRLEPRARRLSRGAPLEQPLLPVLVRRRLPLCRPVTLGRRRGALKRACEHAGRGAAAAGVAAAAAPRRLEAVRRRRRAAAVGERERELEASLAAHQVAPQAVAALLHRRNRLLVLLLPLARARRLLLLLRRLPILQRLLLRLRPLLLLLFLERLRLLPLPGRARRQAPGAQRQQRAHAIERRRRRPLRRARAPGAGRAPVLLDLHARRDAPAWTAGAPLAGRAERAQKLFGCRAAVGRAAGRGRAHTERAEPRLAHAEARAAARQAKRRRLAGGARAPRGGDRLGRRRLGAADAHRRAPLAARALGRHHRAAAHNVAAAEPPRERLPRGGGRRLATCAGGRVAEALGVRQEAQLRLGLGGGEACRGELGAQRVDLLLQAQLVQGGVALRAWQVF
jgi:hypothetical protein